MDLKSRGVIKFLILLGIFAACDTEVVIEDIQDDIAPYPEIESLEEEEPAGDDIEIRDVYVVTRDGDPDYVEFVQEVFDTSLKTDGYFYLKVAGEGVQFVKEEDGLDSVKLSGSTDGTSSTAFQEIVDVLVTDEVRYHIVLLLAKPNATENDTGLDTLLALIYTTRARIDILTMDTDPEPENGEATRKKRQTTTSSSAFSVYQQIAQASGGMVIHATKNNIGSVANLLKQSIKTNPVDIMRFDFPRSKVGKKFKIPVDETMTQMTLQIQTPNARPITMLTMPSGLPVPPTAGKFLGNSLVLYEFNMTKTTDYGQWTVLKAGTSDWDVKVTGQSPVDFTNEFMEPGHGGVGMYPIKGRPIAGRRYQITVKVPSYDKVKSINIALLLDNNNLPAGMPTVLHNVGGRRGKSMFTANITIPTLDFKVAIDGMDKNNNQVRRLNPILVSPISVDLIVPSMAGAKLYVNETLLIPFTVTNEASKKQEVLIKIEDDKKFSQSPVVLSYTLKGGENRTNHFKIKAGLVAGVTATVTITAKPYIRGQITQGQYQIRRFTVEDRQKKKNDTTDPTCNVISVTGKCNIGSDLCACVNHTWSMDVEVGDAGFGVENIFPVGAGSNNSFHHANFNLGDKGPIKASIGSDCCHQLASIQVVDKAGNLAHCSPNITQNFTAPDLSVCNKTNLNQTVGCQSQQQTGQCNFGTDPCDCHTKTWNIKVEFNKTNNIDLHDAYTMGAGINASLKRTGQFVELNPDCCQQHITIVGVDLAGNIGECNVTLKNYHGPKPFDCTSTSPTTTPTTTTSTTATSTTTPASTTGTNTGSSASSSSGTATTKPGQTGTKPPSRSSSKAGTQTQTQTGTGKTSAALTAGASSSATKTPGATNSPGASNSPGATNTPGQTSAPGQTNKPGQTSAPGQTNPPGASNSPGQTNPPGGTNPPGQTKPPGGSNSPGQTNRPGQTNPPGQTGKPPTNHQSGGTTAASKISAGEENNSGVPESAVAAGMTIGAIGAISAVAVMAVLFRRAIGKAGKSVDPNDRKRRSLDDRRDSAWS